MQPLLMTPVPPRSARIVFRRVRLDDAERFDALDRDEGVMRFIDWAPQSLEDQRRTIERHLAEYERFPLHGRYVAESRDGEFLGWFGLLARETPDVPDLGYRLHRRFWGQGLATEGALALIDYASPPSPRRR
jgi:RimJ/RimL family protein N-acetyltransferase